VTTKVKADMPLTQRQSIPTPDQIELRGFVGKLSPAILTRIERLANAARVKSDVQFGSQLLLIASGRLHSEPISVNFTTKRPSDDWIAVAIKLLRPQFESEKAVERFERDLFTPFLEDEEYGLMGHFVGRLSECTSDRLASLQDCGRDVQIDTNTLVKLLMLSDGAFKMYEREVLLPLIEKDIEAHLINELCEVGLIKKKSGKSLMSMEPTGQPIIAPVKYKEEHFGEVDALVVSGMRQVAALDEVFASHFNPEHDSREGFEKQYRHRHLDQKMKRGQ
jgi:hypothetical protein